MAYNLGRIDPEEATGYYADGDVEDEVRPPRRIWRIGAALLVMAAFAGGLWAAYVAGTRHGGSEPADVPLIRADTSPYKVKPQSPGGMSIPDRDLLIYGAQRPQVEHLLPPPEQPMARPAPPAPAPLPPSAAHPQSAPASPSSPALSATRPNSVEPVVASPAPAPAAAAAPSSAPAPDLIAERIDQLAAAAAKSPVKSASADGTAAKLGEMRLQLGAVRSAGEAREEWERLKRSNADLLGKLSAVAVRADLGDKGIYYRIQAGPVATPTIAERICGELHQRRLACIIVR